ncbi:MAG: TonB-dependent receptor [Bacteroidales bacterium]|nr:TonB-dependent receptor [Bacteroidales bacterium]
MKGYLVSCFCAVGALMWCVPSALAGIESTDSCTDLDGSLDEIVVTAVRTPKLLKDVPVQTILITAKDVARTDATNIEELLQQEMPGIEFSYAMNQQVHMNFGGFGGQGVLFLVNGERLAGETMDDVDFNRLDMSNVDRIEIVRGASSAIYGSNAVGGVINIITKDALRPWDIKLNARIGKHREQRYSLTLSNRYKIVSNVLSATLYGIDNYNVESGPEPATRVFTTVYGNKTWNFNDEFTVRPADNVRLTARGGYFRRQLTRTYDTPERYHDYTASVRGEWNLDTSNSLSLSYAFDQYDKSDFHRLSGLDIRSYSNVQNSVRALYIHSFNGGDILTAGADYTHDYLMNTKLDGRTRKQYGADAFLQYDRNINDRMEAVGVIRYDYISDGHVSRVTPKISFRYTPAGQLNLRLSYGMGFRAPTLKEKYYDFDMAGIWIVKGNAHLKPESSHNLNISADYSKRNYNLTVTTYYNKVNDKITTGLPYYLPGDDSQLYLDYVNLDGYSIMGADVTIQGRWNCGVTAKLAYSYNHEFTARDKSGNRANNQYMPTRPHSLVARADWTHDFSKKYSLTVGINGRFLSTVSNKEYKDYYDIDAGTIDVRYPAYTIWRLSCSQQIYDRVKLTLAIDNIFNYKPDYYYLNAPLTDGISFLAGVSVELN